MRFANAAELAAAAARDFVREVNAADRGQKPYCVALSGGRIARTFFAVLAEQAKARAAFFGNIHFFWADERCVPPEDPESNFRIARELLFLPLNVRENQVHRIRGEDPPDSAATSAAADLLRVAASGVVHLPADPAESASWLHGESYPALDLILLGLGEDGHVASLFPGEPVEVAFSRPVYRAIRHSPKPPPNRVTLGYPAIAAARLVWVLASGPGKERALRESLGTGGKTPLAKVLRLRQQTRIFTEIRLDG